MNLGLRDRTALVCGSTSGLGLAIVKALAAEGCAVAVNGRDEGRLASAVKAVDAVADGARAVGIAADVSKQADAERLVARAREALGRIDILLTNAGGPPATTFADAPDHAWIEALELNLLSTIHLCRAAIAPMRERRWGRVIMLTSVAAKQPLGNLILSTTGRAGILGFAKALSDEVAPDGVTVNAICPGFMHTERVNELIDRAAKQQDRTPTVVKDEMIHTIPMRRIGDPEELGWLVAFLASERAAYITGTALQIDGGLIRSVM